MTAFGPLGTLRMAAVAGRSAIAAYGFGLAGVVTSAFLYLAQLPTVVEIWKNGTVGQVSVVPFLMGFINSALWATYSLPSVHPGSSVMLGINVFGAVVMVAYTLIYIKFTADGKERKYIGCVLGAEAIVVICLGLTVLTAVPMHRRPLLLGVFGDITGVLMYLSPLTEINKVRDSRSVTGILYLPTSLALLGNATIWLIYACIAVFDPFVFVPNVVGLMGSLVLLSLFLLYPANDANDDA